VLALTAEIHFRMGDLPRAAIFWYLTECSGKEVDQAAAAMRERYPRAQDLAAALPIRDRIEAFPEPVQDRLHGLQGAVRDETGRVWEPAPRRPRGPTNPPRPASRLTSVGCTLALALCLGVGVVGLITIVNWVFAGF
jgi:hypothetical protein